VRPPRILFFSEDIVWRRRWGVCVCVNSQHNVARSLLSSLINPPRTQSSRRPAERGVPALASSLLVAPNDDDDSLANAAPMSTAARPRPRARARRLTLPAAAAVAALLVLLWGPTVVVHVQARMLPGGGRLVLLRRTASARHTLSFSIRESRSIDDGRTKRGRGGLPVCTYQSINRPTDKSPARSLGSCLHACVHTVIDRRLNHSPQTAHTNSPAHLPAAPCCRRRLGDHGRGRGQRQRQQWELPDAVAAD
jgi:hypothetical protein